MQNTKRVQKGLILIIVCLAATVVFFQQKNLALSRDYSLKQDSLNETKRQILDWRRPKMATKVELFLNNNHLIFFNDSLECHRIHAMYGQNFFDLTFKLKKDSVVDVIAVRYSERNPLTGVGVDTIYAVTQQQIPYSVIEEFKHKLSKVSFSEAIVDNHTFCCFGGGSIALESKITRWKTLHFSTWCRESLEFAQACEFLMKYANDTVLNQILDAQDKNLKNINL